MPAYKQPTLVDYTAADQASASDVQKKLLAAHNSNNAYDEAVVPLLEAYVAEQVKNSTVDVDADLALLKLYLVYPGKTNVEKVTQVLVKGVTALPSTFFTGATTMIPTSVREDANVQAVIEAGFLLQSCLFEEFWTKDLAFAKVVPGFEDAARAFILETISRSHNAIAASVVKAKLNVSDADLKTAIAAEGWTVEGDVVKITANEHNQMRPKKVQEDLQFEDVMKVIHTLSK